MRSLVRFGDHFLNLNKVEIITFEKEAPPALRAALVRFESGDVRAIDGPDCEALEESLLALAGEKED